MDQSIAVHSFNTDMTISKDGSKYTYPPLLTLYIDLHTDMTVNRGRSKCSYPPLFSLNKYRYEGWIQVQLKFGMQWIVGYEFK